MTARPFGPLLIALVLAASGCGPAAAPAPDPAPMAPVAPPDPGDPGAPPPLPDLFVHAAAAGDEVLVLAARPPWGQPAEGVEVRWVRGADTLAETRTGTDGTARIAWPTDDAAGAVLRVGALAVVPERGHTGPPQAEVPVLIDRTWPRPGDRLRILAWAHSLEEAAALAGTLVFPVDAIPPVRLAAPGADVLPGWVRREVIVPDDAPVDSSAGSGPEVQGPTAGIRMEDATIDVRIHPAREAWPPPVSHRDAARVADDGDLVAAPAPGAPLIEADGPRWRVVHPGVEEGAAVALFAEAGGRFVDRTADRTHGGSTALRLAPLPAGAVLTAAVAGPGGWQVGHRRAAPEDTERLALRLTARLGGGSRLEVALETDEAAAFAVAVDDPATARTAFSDRRTRFARTFEGPWHGPLVVVRAIAWFPDRGRLRRAEARVEVPGMPPARHPTFERPGDRFDPAVDGRRSSITESLVTRGVLRPDARWLAPAPTGFATAERITWTVVGAGPDGGALRLRAGEAIVAEVPTGNGAPETGSLPAAALGRDGLSVEAEGDAGAAWLVLEAPVTGTAATLEPVADGAHLARSLPDTAVGGEAFTVALRFGSGEPLEGPVVVRCPLPAGAVVGEDLAHARRRAPAGARVAIEDAGVTWRWEAGLPAGEHTVDVVLEARWGGSFTLPPATLRAGNLAGPRARSAGAHLVIPPDEQ